MRRTAEEAARTREALMRAAMMSFQEKGWRGATFEHVAERAGVTRGALNHHFRSKSELLAESLEWGWAEYGHRLFHQDPARDQGVAREDAADQLVSFLTGYLDLLRGDDLFRAVASTTVLVAPHADDDTKNSKNRHNALDDWKDRIVDMLGRSGDERSAEAGMPAPTVAGLVLVLLQGLTVTAVTRPEDLPQSDNQDAAITALVRGLLMT